MNILFYDIQNGEKLGAWEKHQLVPNIGDDVVISEEKEHTLQLGFKKVYQVIGRLIEEGTAKLYVVYKSNIFGKYKEK